MDASKFLMFAKILPQQSRFVEHLHEEMSYKHSHLACALYSRFDMFY